MFNFYKPTSKNRTTNGKTQANRKAKRRAMNKVGRVSRRINREK